MLVLVVISLSAWKTDADPDLAKAVQKCLIGVFDASADPVALKNWELTITDNGFFRIRKYYPNGKREYFSFKLKHLQLIDYWGTEQSGTLLLRTNGNDIIVQTYNDLKGNIDSTSSVLQIPLRNITSEQLNTVYANLYRLKTGN